MRDFVNQRTFDEAAVEPFLQQIGQTHSSRARQAMGPVRASTHRALLGIALWALTRARFLLPSPLFFPPVLCFRRLRHSVRPGRRH